MHDMAWTREMVWILLEIEQLYCPADRNNALFTK